MPIEKEMLEQLRSGEIRFPPLSVRLLMVEPADVRLDALVEVAWGDIRATYAVECKSLSTPKAFQDGISRLKTAPLAQDSLPMLFVPFLNAQQLQELEKEGISGIDLCGNGVVMVPGRMAVYRSGGRNRFPSSAPIKNIYRKNSSMVGRVFLACPTFQSVQNVLAEINRRNRLVECWNKTPMSLSTVSKALKTLEEDLIISRKGGIWLLQPDKLLDKLRENQSPLNIRRRITLKVSAEDGPIPALVQAVSQESGLPLVAAGISSVGRYAVMPRGAILTVYCPKLETLLDRLPGSQSDRFPDLEIVETDDETVYFDSQLAEDFQWASPVQVYLELIRGDKRDQETAGQVRSYILSNLRTEQQ